MLCVLQALLILIHPETAFVLLLMPLWFMNLQQLPDPSLQYDSLGLHFCSHSSVLLPTCTNLYLSLWNFVFFLR